MSKTKPKQEAKEKEWQSISEDLSEAAPDSVSPNVTADAAAVEDPLEGFDPKIHRSDSDGNPIRKKDGGFALKPNRWRNKSKVAQSKSMADREKEVLARQVSNYTTDSFIMINTMLFGEAAVPAPEVRLGMEQATHTYMVSKGFDKDIPPGLMLGMALTAYYGSMFQHKAPRSRVSRCFNWIKTKVGRKNGAHNDSRTNRVGQNNNSKADSV